LILPHILGCLCVSLAADKLVFSSGRTYSQVLDTNIQDDSNNITRFIALSRTPVPPKAEGRYKTSLVFALNEGSGVLFKALSCFALRDIDLTKIESRPMRSEPLFTTGDRCVPPPIRWPSYCSSSSLCGRSAEVIMDSTRRALEELCCAQGSSAVHRGALLGGFCSFCPTCDPAANPISLLCRLSRHRGLVGIGSDEKGGKERRFQYLFYVDFKASMADPNAQNAVKHLEEMTTYLRVLGCYPMD